MLDRKSKLANKKRGEWNEFFITSSFPFVLDGRLDLKKTANSITGVCTTPKGFLRTHFQLREL